MASAIRQQVRRSAQSSLRQDRELSIGLLFNMVHAGEIIPGWWSKARDRRLRDFAPSSDHFQGAMWMIGAKLANVPFTIQPRDRSIKTHQRLADQYQVIAQNGLQLWQGWSEFWTLFFTDLWTTDNGAFGEVLGGGRPGGQLKPPVIGLNHLDSLRCQRTSNPEYPVKYYDVDGKIYRFHHTRIIFKSQQPSTDAQMYRVGHCWLSRAINNVQQLVDQDVYFQEALGSRPMRQLLLGRGISTKELMDAVSMSEEGMDNQGLRRYAKTAFVGDPNNTDIGIDSIPFSFLPEGYNKQQQTSIAMFVIALAGGFPPRWLWPATAAGATKADAMFQHISGVGGGAQWHLDMMQNLLSYSSVAGNVPAMLPPKFLPKELKIVFDFQDDVEDLQQAEIQKIRAETRKIDLETTVDTIRVSREKALVAGDLSQAQFNASELEDGRLPNGDDVLTLFDSTDQLLIEMLDLGVDEPLLIDANDAIDMIIAIESQALEAQRRMVQAGSKAEREKARRALEALGKLKDVYKEGIIREIEEEVSAEQAAGEFELPETQAAPAGEAEGAEEAEEKAVTSQTSVNYRPGNRLNNARCENCKYILPHDAPFSKFRECKLVSGELALDYVCDLWKLYPLPFSKTKIMTVKERVRQRKQDRFDWAIEFVIADILSIATKETTETQCSDYIDEYLHNLLHSVKAFKFGARVGERIRGGLFRGRGGKFASEADISAIKSEILGRLIARLRAARAGGTGKMGAAKKPGGGGGGKPKPDPAKLAREKRAAERKARAEIFGEDAATMEQLVDFIAGGELDPTTAQTLAQQGFVRFDDTGNPTTTAAGRSVISAATKGDKRRVADIISKARESVAKVQARADKKRESAESARERTDELTSRAEATNADADGLDDDASELLAQADAEEDEKKAKRLRDKAAKLQERAEKKREQAVKLQERATEQDERAATLDTEAGQIEATIGGGGELPAPTPTPTKPPVQEDLDLLTSLADKLNTATPAQLNQLIAAGLADLGGIPGQAAPRLTAAGEAALKKKAMSEKTLEGFSLNVRAAIRSLWLGASDTFVFVDGMSVAIERGFEQAWTEGAAICGVGADERTSAEDAALRQAINAQFPFLPGFATDIQANDKASGGKLGPLFSRGDGWINQYNSVRAQAKLMACLDQKLKWNIDPTKDNCPSCLKLDGKVKRASYWAERNIRTQGFPNNKLECTGLHCGCGQDPTDEPLSKGPLPSLP